MRLSAMKRAQATKALIANFERDIANFVKIIHFLACFCTFLHVFAIECDEICLKMRKRAQTCSKMHVFARFFALLARFCTFLMHVVRLSAIPRTLHPVPFRLSAISRSICTSAGVCVQPLSAISRTKNDVHLLRTLVCRVRDIALNC